METATGSHPASGPAEALAASSPMGSVPSAGAGSVTPSSTVSRPSAETELVAVTSGVAHTCAIGALGRAWCWGDELSGTLGTGDPSWGMPVMLAGSHTFTQISAGSDQTCALDTSGAAWCWGLLLRDVASAPERQSTPEPVRVPGGHVFTAITAGDYAHVCALDGSGKAWCWGSDEYGELGDAGGASAGSNTPVPVRGEHVFSAISAGGRRTCALDNAGKAWCWGGNGESGQLGTGSTAASVDSPVAVVGGRIFASLDAGQSHTCGVDDDGKAWCWGSEEYGKLGNPVKVATDMEDSATRRFPVAAGSGHRFVTISAGMNRTCAVDEAGAAWCWGVGTSPPDPSPEPGSDGDQGFSWEPTPTLVSGGHRFESVAVGSTVTCAVERGGRSWCWGADDFGQRGDGGTEIWRSARAYRHTRCA